MTKQEYARQWYAANQQEQRTKANARQARYRSLNIRLRTLILSAQPCADCGEPPDPDTPFEFDHREGVGADGKRVSGLITNRSNHHEMMREIPKCDVVCPTCHKARTYNRGQWKRATHRPEFA